jgi:hypothetical protein
MTYTFRCPSPCRRVIRVDASSDDDAVRKILKGGAIACRNVDNHDSCEAAHPRMSPLTDGQLREAVRWIMTAEDLPEVERRA